MGSWLLEQILESDEGFEVVQDMCKFSNFLLFVEKLL